MAGVIQMLVFVGKAAFLTWGLCAGLWDLDSRRVPNWWMLVGYLLAGGMIIASLRARALSPQAGMIVAAVVFLSLLYWSQKWWGGADAKFMIVSVFVFPTPGFLAAQVAGQALSALVGGRSKRRSFPAVLVMALSMFGYVLVNAAISLWPG